MILGVSTWCTYRFTKQTASLYNVLSEYSSNLISLADAKQTVKSNIAAYVVLMIATPALFALATGGGQVLATLYTRRQMIYIARLLLDRSAGQVANNLLYHSKHMEVIPNFLSHDIAELNSQFFYLIIGHIYYTGIIGENVHRFINFNRDDVCSFSRSGDPSNHSFSASQRTKRWIPWCTYHLYVCAWFLHLSEYSL